MKFSLRFLSLFLCLVLSLIVFSGVVSADSISLKDYQISIIGDYYSSSQYYRAIDYTIYSSSSSNIGIEEPVEFLIKNNDTSYVSIYNYLITNVDKSPLIYKGGDFELFLTDVYYSTFFHNNVDSSQQFYSRTISNKRAVITYSDNSIDNIDGSDIQTTQDGPILNLSFSHSAPKDIVSVEFIITSGADFSTPHGGWTFVAYSGTYDNSKWALSINQSSEEVGLLSGIISWIQSIFSKLGDIGQSIVDLPSKIWQFISDGLKGLFVPSDDYILHFKDDIDTLLSDRLGAVYQVVSIMGEGWEQITANDVTNTIDFPEVTIPLPDDCYFTFGGQVVQIVPDGFEVVVSALKMIVGISCTILFVNGLRKRYDEVMGVEQ